MKRQAGFISFIEKQDMSLVNLPAEVYHDLFDVVTGILVGLADISPHTKESSELLYKNKLALFRILYLQPKKLHLCVIDTELLAAMQFSRMILSENKDQRTLAIDFCSFLLYHDKNLTLGELVGYDQKSRDYILKHDFIKVW